MVRRGIYRAAIAAHIVLVSLALAVADERWQVEVRETSGLARFKYPVTGQFDGPPESAAHFQLYEGEPTVGNKPIAAQFSSRGHHASGLDHYDVDFSLDLAPGEIRKLTIVRCDAPQPAAATRGLTIKRAIHRVGGRIFVRHPSLEFEMDMHGLIRAINVGDDAWLTRPAEGLVLRSRGSESQSLRTAASAPASISKNGPLAVQLQYEGKVTWQGDQETKWTATVDFPLGKSWYRVELLLDDPADVVAAASTALELKLDATPTEPVLADVGAAGWTYLALKPEESLVFHAGPHITEWGVDRVTGDKATPLVAPAHHGSEIAPHGWGHLMDRKRATAVAVDRFAEGTDDRIELAAGGRLLIAREFPQATLPEQARTKRLVYWVHVVRFPPQLGAATSPQSMMSPPLVQIVPLKVDASAADAKKTEENQQ